MRPIWKLVGLAGIAGVAATGVAVVRAERRRAAYAPEQVRERLHERYKQANPGRAVDGGDPSRITDDRRP